MQKKEIIILHAEPGHPSEVITDVTGRAIGLHLTGTFNSCEDCTLGKAKKESVSKKNMKQSKILGERLFFDISSPLSSTLGGKKHWLMVVEDSTNYAWNYL